MNGEKDKPITVVIDDLTINKFLIDCQNLSLTKNSICGIDFEFDMNWKTKERYISLMQIILISEPDKYTDHQIIKPIYILDPLRQLSDRQMEQLIEYIFCSNVIKIFHGSDSLDFPHIYTSILKNNKKRFIKFLNKSVDTRFLCEISKRVMRRIGMININDNKCSLYNALLDHKVIDKHVFDALTVVSSKINYNKKWEIEKLSPEQINYSSLDVSYLFDLLSNIIRFISENHRSNKLLSTITRLYRFHIINKLEIIKISNKCKKIVDSKNLTKDQLYIIDQKIMEHYFMDVLIEGKPLTIYFEDILSIDTTRKSILFCLRAFALSDDYTLIDKYFSDSKIFNRLKGHRTVIKLINVIKKKHQNRTLTLTQCDLLIN